MTTRIHWTARLAAAEPAEPAYHQGRPILPIWQGQIWPHPEGAGDPIEIEVEVEWDGSWAAWWYRPRKGWVRRTLTAAQLHDLAPALERAERFSRQIRES